MCLISALECIKGTAKALVSPHLRTRKPSVEATNAATILNCKLAMRAPWLKHVETHHSAAPAISSNSCLNQLQFQSTGASKAQLGGDMSHHSLEQLATEDWETPAKYPTPAPK
jgi:hypothetical protein